MSSKSPFKDYSRLLGIPTIQDRTVKKQNNLFKQRIFDTSDRIVDELRMKLQLSLKHNAKLLDQNAALSQMVSKLKFQVKRLNEQINLVATAQANNVAKVKAQRATLLDQLQIKQINHQSQIKNLLQQISRLHTQKNDLQIIKNKQMQQFRQQHQKNMSGCIQSIRSTQQNAKDLYQTQISKLKQMLQVRQRQTQSIKIENKLKIDKFQDTIKSYQKQIQHIKKMNEIQRNQLQNNYKVQLHRQRRILQRQNQINTSNQQLVLKRLKNQLHEKNNQINLISKKIANNQQMHSLELDHLKRQKQQLLSEIATEEVSNANSMTKQKAKIRQINEQEVKNILDLNQVHIGQLRNEINHIKNLLDCKSNQVRRLYEENNGLKKSINAQMQLQVKINQELKNRLKIVQRDHMQAFEAFKIKIAQLIDADIKSLCSYYQNEAALLQTNVNSLQEINKNNKQKLYKALQDNDQIRKNFQIQISKQKARVQDLKIKLAAINLQHKQQVTSLATKMQLTSQTLVREADQKQKSQVFFDEEKRKYHSLSNSKDKQIADLLQSMHRMKKMHESQILILRTQKKQLRDQIQSSQDRINILKVQYQTQLKRREQKAKTQHKADNKEKQLIRQLYDKNEKVQNQNIKLQKQVEHLVRENRSIAGQLGLKKGYIQTLHLESSAAIEDQKTKIRQMMGNNQVTLKQFFEQKLASRQKDIEHLQTVLAAKQQDIRDLIIKYNGLQKRLQALLASQEKLRDLQEKVKNLGLDNNLVKNMAQLFNRQK